MRQRHAATTATAAEPRASAGVPRRTTASREPRRPTAGPPLAELEFDGTYYRRLRLSPDEIADHDGRVEFWDGATNTAFEVREASPYHERPAQRLSALAELIAAVRGKPILCFGTMNLELPGDDGRPARMMQADQSLYLHPERSKLVGPAAMVVGEHHYPDVVLEVDRTTDVRRHKLRLYEAWGFPELWVDVPDQSPRPQAQHGATLYVRQEGALEAAAESRAFPGWTAADIHIALNEPRLSNRTAAILERIGAVLGEREGSGPDDHPLLRSQRQRARAAMVRELLIARGFYVDANLLLKQPAFAAASAQAIVDAAARCESADDFVAMLRAAVP